MSYIQSIHDIYAAHIVYAWYISSHDSLTWEDDADSFAMTFVDAHHCIWYCYYTQHLSRVHYTHNICHHTIICRLFTIHTVHFPLYTHDISLFHHSLNKFFHSRRNTVSLFTIHTHNICHDSPISRMPTCYYTHIFTTHTVTHTLSLSVTFGGE